MVGQESGLASGTLSLSEPVDYVARTGAVEWRLSAARRDYPEVGGGAMRRQSLDPRTSGPPFNTGPQACSNHDRLERGL